MRDAILAKFESRAIAGSHGSIRQFLKAVPDENARIEASKRRYQQAYIEETPALPAALWENPRAFLRFVQALAEAPYRRSLIPGPNCRITESHRIEINNIDCVIGPGGAILRGLEKSTGCQILAPQAPQMPGLMDLMMTGEAAQILVARQAIHEQIILKYNVEPTTGRTRTSAPSPIPASTSQDMPDLPHDPHFLYWGQGASTFSHQWGITQFQNHGPWPMPMTAYGNELMATLYVEPDERTLEDHWPWDD